MLYVIIYSKMMSKTTNKVTLSKTTKKVALSKTTKKVAFKKCIYASRTVQS